MSRSNPTATELGHKKPRKPRAEKAPDPNTITTSGHQEFEEVCAREDRGELEIRTLFATPRNGVWRFAVTYRERSRM